MYIIYLMDLSYMVFRLGLTLSIFNALLKKYFIQPLIVKYYTTFIINYSLQLSEEFITTTIYHFMSSYMYLYTI